MFDLDILEFAWLVAILQSISEENKFFSNLITHKFDIVDTAQKMKFSIKISSVNVTKST